MVFGMHTGGPRTDIVAVVTRTQWGSIELSNVHSADLESLHLAARAIAEKMGETSREMIADLLSGPDAIDHEPMPSFNLPGFYGNVPREPSFNLPREPEPDESESESEPMDDIEAALADAIDPSDVDDLFDDDDTRELDLTHNND